VTTINSRILALLSATAVLVGASSVAHAASVAVPLDATTTSAGTTYFNTNPMLSSGSYTYANTLTGTGQTVGTTGQGFFDDYVFSIAASTADSVTSTINLGNSQISNLQASIFSYSGGSLPLFGSTLPPGTVELDGWSTAFSNGSYAVIAPVTLTAGTYALEIRGTVPTSGATGTYSGVLNLAAAPVPLPAGLPLLLSGVAGLGFWVRRRRA
jgi:hypothetical protein